MQSWHKYSNYRQATSEDGSIAYIITVDGTDVQVNKAIYEEYAAAGRKMKYMELDLKRNRFRQDATGKAVRDENGQPIELPEREVSLDKLIDEDWDYPSLAPSPEDIFVASEFSEEAELHRCLSLLADEERTLITALFFEGMTEAEYAKIQGVKQQSINERKRRILKKLKIFFGSPC